MTDKTPDEKYQEICSLCDAIKEYAYGYLFGDEFEFTALQIKTKKHYLEMVIAELVKKYGGNG